MPSIVKKALMAVTGLLWFGFLITHVMGNSLLFLGPERFNAYPKHLEDLLGPLLYVAEASLLILLLLHIYAAVRVTSENKTARPADYAKKRETKGQSTFASRTMIFGGLILAVFLVLHIRYFKLGGWETHPLGLYGVVTDLFRWKRWVLFYLVAMVALGLHLSHGLASGLQTLGVSKPAWRPKLRIAGLVIGWAITAAFMSMPIWGYLR